MKTSILLITLSIVFSIYSFKPSENNGVRTRNLSSLTIGNNTIPVAISEKGNIEIQQLSTEEILVPTFQDTIIMFDPTYYYDKIELSGPEGNTRQVVFSGDGLQLNKESFLNTSNPVNLITESKLPFVPTKFFATIIKQSGVSFSKGYDLTHAHIKSEDKTAKKQEFITNELKWIFDNAQSGDQVLIWKIRFEHERKRYDFKQNILINIL